MAFVRTILGDVDIQNLGITYSHEHIVIDSCYVTDQYPEFLLNDYEKISAELLILKDYGVTLIVDAMPLNAGRNPKLLSEISQMTNVSIISTTGLHLENYYPTDHWRYTIGEDQLTQLFIDDIEIGIDENDHKNGIVNRTTNKAGLIKLATDDGPITPHQEMIFRAVVNAHLHTGAPILTHTNDGKLALDQAIRFEKLGADLNHVVLSHTDRNPDINYQKELLETGVNVEYDSAFRWKPSQVNNTFKLLEKFLPLYPNQITVGMDAARSTYWHSYGGALGLGYLMNEFLTELKQRNLDQFFDNLFINNPHKIFTFK